jgi:hypothetical protein
MGSRPRHADSLQGPDRASDKSARMSQEDAKSTAPFLLVSISCCLIIVALSVRLFGFVSGPELPAGRGLWAIYFVLGSVFPIAALAVMKGSTPERVRFAIAAIGTVLVLRFAMQTRHYGALSLGIIELILAWPLIRSTWRDETRRGWAGWTLAVVLIGSWIVAASMPWMTPLEEILTGRSPVFTNGFAAAVGIVIATIWGTLSLTHRSGDPPKAALRIVDAAAVILFAIAAFRCDLYFARDDLHAAFFVAPIEAIRQGGWLLWDVPSQYGIGNIWLAAHVPAHTSYGSLVYANCAALFVAAVLNYLIARTWAKTLPLAIFCVCALAATHFLWSGLYIQSTGAQHYPSIGAFRFVWCYVFTALVVLCYCRGWLSTAPRTVLNAGNICWALAACWSFEAAVFTTIIWFPASAAIVLQRAGSIVDVLASWLRAILGLVMIAAVVLAAFLIHFHHGPDWYAFLEYALVYQGGFGSLPMEARGSVWVLIAAFAAVISVGIYAWYEKRFQALPVLIAAAAVQWSSASYFVVRSHENNVNNLMPLVLLGLFATMAVVTKENLTGTIPVAFRLLFVPLLALPLGLASGAASLDTKSLVADGWLAGNPGNWAALARPIPATEMNLLQRNGLTPSSPLLYVEPNLYSPPRWPGSDAMPRLWMPDFSLFELGILSAERQELYLRRFAADGHPTVGYLLENTEIVHIAVPKALLTAMGSVFTNQDVDHDGIYVLKRYSLKP